MIRAMLRRRLFSLMRYAFIIVDVVACRRHAARRLDDFRYAGAYARHTLRAMPLHASYSATLIADCRLAGCLLRRMRHDAIEYARACRQRLCLPLPCHARCWRARDIAAALFSL